VGEGGRVAEAVAWELDRPAINGGDGRLGAGRFRGGEEAKAAVGE
jgi:hypothetical protein